MAPAEPKLVVHGTRHRLELSPYAVEVDASDGGRIVEFSVNGKNAFATASESPAAYGTSFWPSPQSDWNWPPPIEFDRGTWTSSSEGSTILLTSAVHPALGLCASERLRFEPSSRSLHIDYTLENRGTTVRSVAPWQNSRVRPRGLTFYPSRGDTLPGSTLALPLVGGVAWLRHDPETMLENQKSFADGAEGWLAHVADRTLFVKVWDEVPRQRQAPGEAEVELYVDKTGKFVEVEQQGAYEALAPGASLTWTVRFALEPLAEGVRVETGSSSLVEAARALAARARSGDAGRH